MYWYSGKMSMRLLYLLALSFVAFTISGCQTGERDVAGNSMGIRDCREKDPSTMTVDWRSFGERPTRSEYCKLGDRSQELVVFGNSHIVLENFYRHVAFSLDNKDGFLQLAKAKKGLIRQPRRSDIKFGGHSGLGPYLYLTYEINQGKCVLFLILYKGFVREGWQGTISKTPVHGSVCAKHADSRINNLVEIATRKIDELQEARGRIPLN